MARTKITVGVLLRLILQDFEGNNTVFPQVILKDDDGAALVGSPVNLVLDGDGMYRDKSIQMPDTPMVTAQYIVYSDSGHTIIDPDNEYALDIFELEANAISIVPQDSNIVGIVDDDLEFIGTVDDDSQMIGIVDEDLIVGTVDDDLLLGVVESEDELIGIVTECA